jgi:hypothetical protein
MSFVSAQFSLQGRRSWRLGSGFLSSSHQMDIGVLPTGRLMDGRLLRQAHTCNSTLCSGSSLPTFPTRSEMGARITRPPAQEEGHQSSGI